MARTGAASAGVRESNAAAVLSAVRVDGPLARAEIARRTGLSMPTVSRQVGVLIDHRLLRELPDAARNGGLGRPTVPVDLDTGVVAACGVHIGVSTTTYALTDVRGRLLDSEHVPTAPAADVLEQLAERVLALCARRPDRTIIGVGLVTGGRVDQEWGTLDHDRIGWSGVPAREVLRRATGLPVHLGAHVPAMASAELLFGSAGRADSALYFYARQVVGAAFAAHGRLHRGPGEVGTIAHLPVGGDVPCPCGRTGCLEVTVAEDRLVADAVREGVLAEPGIGALYAAARAGDPGAHRLLGQRAAALGRAVGLLRDIVNPDLVVLGGQAITDAPEYFGDLVRAYEATTALPRPGIVERTRFGPHVQAMAACTGLLAELYERPFSVLAAVPG
ncbi:putative NBD/HSP70 family sugar kinase [Prauserella shujinwangii]|uniref:Putative NBD/HSP70 family sugar kinase n=1 Tax=Prauserella shujinwangii TaxID=1453103 RepID=A0A2T0M2M6_9PSEU|nr:ROK family transcriptional regulator [Prauserella shujinwangii]PRX50972.1 putative NBD/HSP70 family sugar kinase [Prauserella shujinwangii]